MAIDKATAGWLGTLGGIKSTPAKVRSARVNGCKSAGAPGNGRPRTRPLVYWLLRRKLTPDQCARAQVAIGKMDNKQLGAIKRALRMPAFKDSGYFFDLCTTTYRVPRKLGPGTSALLAILRAYIRAAISGKV